MEETPDITSGMSRRGKTFKKRKKNTGNMKKEHLKEMEDAEKKIEKKIRIDIGRKRIVGKWRKEL